MNEYLGGYATKTFADIWTDVDSFLSDYTSSGIPAMLTSTDTAKTLYYLLYARYGNSSIANNDENMFKYGVFSTIFQYGPTWEKKLDIQKALRELDIETLRVGSKSISNIALNPQNEPGTQSLEELTYINQQNTNNTKKSYAQAYAQLTELLKDDVSETFLKKFKNLFIKVVYPSDNYFYNTEV